MVSCYYQLKAKGGNFFFRLEKGSETDLGIQNRPLSSPSSQLHPTDNIPSDGAEGIVVVIE